MEPFTPCQKRNDKIVVSDEMISAALNAIEPFADQDGIWDMKNAMRAAIAASLQVFSREPTADH